MVGEYQTKQVGTSALKVFDLNLECSQSLGVGFIECNAVHEFIGHDSQANRYTCPRPGVINEMLIPFFILFF
jgi:hypothetical protein